MKAYETTKTQNSQLHSQAPKGSQTASKTKAADE